MKNEFVISVIIPVYNTEKYLSETIESIRNQTLDFITNIQIILVDDASSDQSSLICRRYKGKYPHNFEYVVLDKNRGAGYCRNIGLKLISGKYVVFTDSDDKWSTNAFKRAVNFLEENKGKIDLVSANMEYFDAFQKPHILNMSNIFDEVIDINQSYRKIRTAVPCFIKSNVAKQYRFNENQLFREDTVFINSIILRQQRFGMLGSDVIYYYRRRRDDTSIVQECFNQKGYYLKAPKQLFEALYMESMKNCGNFVPMMQFVIAYDTLVRFTEPVNNLSDEELKVYYEILFDNIQFVEDKFLLEVNFSDIETKKLLVAYKHNKELARFIINDKKKDKQLNEQWICLQKSRYNYKIIKKMLRMRQQGSLLKDYFIKNNYYRIAIYGFADLGKLLYEELKNTEISVVYLIDRNAGRISTDIPIGLPEEELKEVDVIVITSVYYYAEIKEMLCKKTKIPVISIEEVMGEKYN